MTFPIFLNILSLVLPSNSDNLVKGYLGAAEVLQKLFKYHAKNLVEQQVAPTQ